MDLVFDFFENKINLESKDTIVIGVSGGPDSMCLLYILKKLSEKIGFKIVVAHINHKKRIESDEEEEFLKKYTEENNLIFECSVFKTTKTGNFHKLARDFRYDFYQSLIKKYNALYLMTAHHGDDLIETIMMRLVRGSTLIGYHGMSIIKNMDSYSVIRPLLLVTKEEIKEFNNSNKIPYRTDVSNYSAKYTRNRYRKYLLPFLKEEEKNVHLKFLKFSKLIEESYNYIEKKVLIAYNDSYKDGSLSILKFQKLDEFIQKLVLEKILKDLYSDLSEINDKHIELILKLIKNGKTGSMLNLPNSYICIINYQDLTFQKEISSESYKFLLKDGLVLPNGMSFIEYNGLENGNDILHLSSLDIKLPLYVRSKKTGDYIELKGLNGKKKVSDIFIDMKINKLDRNIYPVVVDSNDTVLWIPKLKKSKYDGQNVKKCDIIFKCL